MAAPRAAGACDFSVVTYNLLADMCSAAARASEARTEPKLCFLRLPTRAGATHVPSEMTQSFQ
eukprot:3558257-Prymnesium_polylepis.1